MKNLFIPAVLSGLLLVGCSSAYRTAQTPDDVYFSSSPNVPVVAKAERTEYRNLQGGQAETDGEYQSYWGNSDDNYLKMKVQNGGRWNSLDDYSYWNGYGYNNGFTFNPFMYNYSYSAFNRYNPWGFQNYNNYWGHNSWYNGYGYPYGYAALGYGFGSGFGYGGYNNYYGGGGYYPVIVINKNPVNYNPSRPSLAGYSNNTYYNRSNGRNVATPAQQQPRSLFRSVFSTPSSNGNVGGNVGSTAPRTSVDRPARTFNTTPSSSTPASSGSSSGGSRSGGSTSGSRGGRGG
jgi:hypothetical protein